jgi:hypothetical protein
LPNLVNEMLYVDFFEVDAYNGRDLVMTICDALSRFAQFIPLNKKYDGKKVLKLLERANMKALMPCKISLPISFPRSHLHGF